MKKIVTLCSLFLLIQYSIFAQTSFPVVVNPYQSYFNKAYALYPEIPRGTLEAVAFTNTHFKHITHTANEPKGCAGIPEVYGVMGLTLDGKNYFNNNLNYVATLSGYSSQEIIDSPEKSILAYAKAFDILQTTFKAESNGREDLIANVLISLSELSNKSTQQNYSVNAQLYSVFAFMNNPAAQLTYHFSDPQINMSQYFGDNYKVLSASKVIISRTEIKTSTGELYHGVDHSTSNRSPDYGPAIWDPTTCNYSSRSGTAISAVTIHDMEGSYAGSINWFQNCGAQVSAHYCIRSSDGQITQVVRESDKAWHVANDNPYTIGLEHEGYSNDASWYTMAMYTESAKLTCGICDWYGIPRSSCWNVKGCSGTSSTCGISSAYQVKGHQNFYNQSHSDPGPNWDWPVYYNLVNSCGTSSGTGNLPKATTDAADCSSIRGWAYDPDVPNTSINVDIYIGGTKVYGGITGTPRPDVNAAFGISGDHGYDLPLPGEYQDGINRIVDVYAINNNGPNVLVSSSDLRCGSLVPKFTLDVMDCNELRGWAYDPDVSSSSIDVHLYVDNNMVAAIPTNDSRADVNAAFGISGTHGFVYTVPDLYKDGQTHTFALYAINNDGYNALNSATTFGPCYVIPSGFNAQQNTCPNIGVTLNWQHTANGFFLDIGTDPNFAMGTFFNKDVSSLTSVVCPGGFCEYTGGACNGNYLDFQPNTTYYWRIFNGSVHTSAGSFTTPSCSYVDNSNCSGSFSDMGAGSNYTDNEDYTYTYSPPGASSVDVQFTTFGTENGYDFLYLYDGNSTSAPLIGTYTGNTLPNGGNKISSTGGSITMKFHSDPFTNDIGFTGTYSCSQISTSINEANTSKLLISPNPSNGVFHITLPKNFTGNASELTVVDVVGKEVLHLVNPEAITVIDLPVKGIYFLQLKNENSLVSQKIIAQ